MPLNDLESRMQNETAVIELDQPQQNWICLVWIGSAGFDLETAVIGVKILYYFTYAVQCFQSLMLKN